eukprot:gb/GECG01001600.1/.p1 GENE.gb/GECG01001600.1/~~gb/GECG01001600.1/.p1  ORF type:complete len:187 (+),score=26.42 gb/GECG01001600.1/:1-561(+)
MEFWIEKLNMEQHPEGGYCAETYTCKSRIAASSFSDDPATKEASTMTGIYFLLEENDVSALHNLCDSDEMWHFYDGDPLIILELEWSPEQEKYTVHQTKLGNPMTSSEEHQDAVPQHVVKGGRWFGAVPAKPAGKRYSLVGCTSSPGFTFHRFKLCDKSLASDLQLNYLEQPIPPSLETLLPKKES